MCARSEVRHFLNFVGGGRRSEPAEGNNHYRVPFFTKEIDIVFLHSAIASAFPRYCAILRPRSPDVSDSTWTMPLFTDRKILNRYHVASVLRETEVQLIDLTC